MKHCIVVVEANSKSKRRVFDFLDRTKEEIVELLETVDPKNIYLFDVLDLSNDENVEEYVKNADYSFPRVKKIKRYTTPQMKKKLQELGWMTPLAIEGFLHHHSKRDGK